MRGAEASAPNLTFLFTQIRAVAGIWERRGTEESRRASGRTSRAAVCSSRGRCVPVQSEGGEVPRPQANTFTKEKRRRAWFRPLPAVLFPTTLTEGFVVLGVECRTFPLSCAPSSLSCLSQVWLRPQAAQAGLELTARCTGLTRSKGPVCGSLHSRTPESLVQQ